MKLLKFPAICIGSTVVSPRSKPSLSSYVSPFVAPAKAAPAPESPPLSLSKISTTSLTADLEKRYAQVISDPKELKKIYYDLYLPSPKGCNRWDNADPGHLTAPLNEFLRLRLNPRAPTAAFFNLEKQEVLPLTPPNKSSFLTIFYQTIQRMTLDDPSLISLAEELKSKGSIEVQLKTINAVEAMLNPDTFVHKHTSDIEALLKADASKISSFVTAVKEMEKFLQANRKVLEKHRAFKDIPDLVSDLQVIVEIIDKAKLQRPAIKRKGEEGVVVELPRSVRGAFGDIERMPTKSQNVSKAYQEVLFDLKLDLPLNRALSIMTFFQYLDEAKRDDNARFSCQPVVLPLSDDGLYLKAKDIVHPLVVEQKGRLNSEDLKALTAVLRKAGISTLEKINVLGEGFGSSKRRIAEVDFCEADFEEYEETEEEDEDDREEEDDNKPFSTAYRFRPGLSLDSLETALSKTPFTLNQIKAVTDLFEKTAFQPFSGVLLDPQSTVTYLLSGANARGKSTLLKSIALQYQYAQSLRGTPSGESTLSVCDWICHNIGKTDDLVRGISTLRMQMKLVVKYLENATINSLGLFDELFNGTSPPYQLALAWATIEEISRRKLRCFISTHNPALTWCTEREGYEKIKGQYAFPKAGERTGLHMKGIQNISLTGNYVLGRGAVTDSEAFAIAEEEGFPLLKRAKEILAHVTGAY